MAIQAQPSRVRQIEAQRIIKAACKSGLTPKRIRVHDAGYDIIFDDDGLPGSAIPNPWDEVPRR